MATGVSVPGDPTPNPASKSASKSRPNYKSKPSADSSSDVLSDVLSICRSERAVTARFALTAPWGLQSEGTQGALIRMARGQGYWMQVEGLPDVRVDAGDLVMLPPGVRHRIVSAPGAKATPFSELIRRHAVGIPGDNPLVFSHGGEADGKDQITDLFSAQVWFSAYSRHTVLRILPPYIHVREKDLPIANMLGSTMQSLIEETLARRPGWRLSAGRMGELLLVNILREHLAHDGTRNVGWLRGISDPAIARVIMRIHNAPQHNWTLVSLGREAGLSRTRLSARFKELVGESPIVYLTGHRMALAAQELESGNLHLTQIAENAGYESSKVFARAFKRWSGLSPRAYVRDGLLDSGN